MFKRQYFYRVEDSLTKTVGVCGVIQLRSFRAHPAWVLADVMSSARAKTKLPKDSLQVVAFNRV